MILKFIWLWVNYQIHFMRPLLGEEPRWERGRTVAERREFCPDDICIAPTDAEDDHDADVPEHRITNGFAQLV